MAVAAGISTVGAVVLEAICDAGVGKVGLSACDFGFEFHLAIATTMASKAKKKTTRNLFMRSYFFDSIHIQMLKIPATSIPTTLAQAGK